MEIPIHGILNSNMTTKYKSIGQIASPVYHQDNIDYLSKQSS